MSEEDRAMLPYIHTHRSYSPTLYMDEESPYWYNRWKYSYLDNYYRLHPHHAYWYDYHKRHHHYRDHATRLSLPKIRFKEDYSVDPRYEAHFRWHRDRCDPYCSFCKPPVKKLVPSMHYDEVWSYGPRTKTRYIYY